MGNRAQLTSLCNGRKTKRVDNNAMCAFVHLIHYLPLWPVILGKDGIVRFHCPICHQHNGLATLTSPPSLIKLERERERQRELTKAKQSSLQYE